MIIFGSSDIGTRDYINKFKKVFKISIKELKKINFNYLNLKKKKIKFIITGSRPGKNSLDIKLLLWAKKNNILTIGIIEHYTNYEKRFKYGLSYIYPDKIIVNDLYSFKLALKNSIPRKKLVISWNPIFFIYSKIKKIKIKKNKKIIIIISERINGKKKFINYLIKNYSQKYNIIIKLHPAENKLNFKIYNSKIKIIRKLNFFDIVRNAKFIIGFQSILLINLSIFRNDIISILIKNINNNFMGYKKKIIYPIKEVPQLEQILKNKKIVANKIFKPKFTLKNNLFEILK